MKVNRHLMLSPCFGDGLLFSEKVNRPIAGTR